MRSFLGFHRMASLLLVGTGLMTGCGGGAPPECVTGSVLDVSPAAATVDHLAMVPGNQVRFTGVSRAIVSPGCALPLALVLEDGTWTNPDPANITISSAKDETNGTAVCKGRTASAVTLTGAFTPRTIPPSTAPATVKTVQLTCQ